MATSNTTSTADAAIVSEPEADTSVFALDKIPPEQRDAYWRKHIYRADKEPQLTVRGAIFGGLIGILACASSMYTSLKIGWGFGIALVAVILSFVVFNFIRSVSGGRIKSMGVLENAATSSVASVTGMTTTHTVVSAFGALMLLQGVPAPWYKMVPTLFFSALLGTCIAIPMKRALINQERLRFPSAIASAETLKSLYATSGNAVTKNKVRTLLGALGLAAVLGIIKQLPTLASAFAEIGKTKFADFCTRFAFVPDAIGLPDFLNPLKLWGGIQGSTVVSDKGVKAVVPEDANLPGVSLDASVLLIGAGMLCGLRVSLTMFFTAIVLDWWVAPWLISQDILNAGTDIFRNIEASVDAQGNFTGFRVVYWSLWMGTAIMVMSSFTALAFQWRTIGRAFSGIFPKKGAPKNDAGDDPVADVEVPMKWFVIGVIPSAIGLIITLHFAFNTAWYLGVLAIFLAGAFGLICARSCGEADTNPIGAMGKISQLIYSVMPGARGNVSTNLITGGVTAAAGGASGDLMSDMKLGNLLGLKPRIQFWTQLLAICIGTTIAVPVWRLLVPSVEALEKYPAPPARMWKAVAEFLNDPLISLPTTVYWAMSLGALIGIAIPVCEKLFPKYRAYMPSAMGMGIVLTLPAAFNNAASFAIGAIAVWAWNKFHPKSEENYSVALASGLVGGESIACALAAMAATAILL
ncbi:MAG: OPT family oligopeptide transporter [Verrucomicrobia bacterium]|nr:OPT family oligopeptide transporter [Verrucomicrobiota bacterium]